MITTDLARKIRHLEISTRKAVNDVLAGEYHSVFKGRGMEFDEVREYQPGDDVRAIDWNVTARTGRPHIKHYVEERELTIMLLVDLSASAFFGSTDRTKNEIAADICALLAFSAIKNNDKVGLLLFTDRVEQVLMPAKGARHVLRLLRELLAFSPRRRGTDISAALDYLGRITHRRAIVFLLSDFQAVLAEKQLRIMARRHDFIAVSINDPLESTLPDAGLVTLQDAETGDLLVVDTGSAGVRQQYAALTRTGAATLAATFAKAGVDHIPVTTDRDYLKDLVAFFRRREIAGR